MESAGGAMGEGVTGSVYETPAMRQAGPVDLPALARDTTADRPWPVRLLNQNIAQYVARMSPLWVEGQILNLKRWNSLYFLTLRDPDVDQSISVTVPTAVLDRAVPAGQQLDDGTRVVVHAQPNFHPKKGSLGLQADDARLVGLGELLARLEHLKTLLAAEGLFDASRKRPLPFLPGVVGLVVAQQGDAEHDVVTNARLRWPAVRFEIRRVTVQGPQAVPSVTRAIAELDADPLVEVIVVARGGGSFEDLLPFSNEALIRAAAACRTPLVSAIGHEMDSPLLDLVADLRASTPTDAAKRIVPDVAQERLVLREGRRRARAAVLARVAREQERLTALRTRPALARPETLVETRRGDVVRLRTDAHRAVSARLTAGAAEVARLAAQVRTLSPAAVLDRGYAVVQLADGTVVREPIQAPGGTNLRIRIAAGELSATVN